MTREEAQELVKKHGTQRKAATMAGVSRHTIARALGIEKGGSSHNVKAAISTKLYTSPVVARSVSDFRNTYDLNTIVPKKIAAGFKQLGAGWLYESEFAKAAGLTMKDLGMFRDNYAAHIVVVGDSRRIWAGKKTVAEQMRSMI